MVPLVHELTHRTIGGYMSPDPDDHTEELPADVLQRDSADFWSTFNQAAGKTERIELDEDGLPDDSGDA